MFKDKTKFKKIFRIDKKRLSAISFLTLSTLLFIDKVQAGEVSILAADLKQQSNLTWSLSVTLKHADTGWDHYADNWRLVDKEGEILGDRVLFHPHVNEQPFTR